ncbi:MAG: hypothetical protein JOZ38_04515 [Candidatus Eremiobacteraeota bacterium]|nr:hypothetical protein [Candidatus Eremiobacteraeota bacterium]
MNVGRAGAVAVCLLMLWGCGQKTENSSTGANSALVSTAAPGGNAQTSSRSTAAPVPAGMQCAAGAAPVWANLKSHAYHLPGDDYYGRTAHGKYLCAEDAQRLGYHQAGTRHMTPSEMQMSPGPAVAPSEAPTPSRKHHKHHATQEEPTPEPT